jgi:hypothetical protein
MSESLHPESAPTTAGGESAIDQVAAILSEDATEESSNDDIETTNEDSSDSYDGDMDDGDVEPESPNQYDEDDNEFDGDEEGLAALAQELGVDSDKLGLDEDGQIVVRVKVNGENKEVSLTEAISGTQYRAANDQKAQELAESRKSFDTERQQVAEEFSRRLQHVQGVGQMLEQRLMAEYNNVDWQALRVSDPSEFLIRQQEFQARHQELHQAGQAIGQQMQLQSEQADKEWQQERSQILSTEREVMVQAVPEWQDKQVMKKDLGSIVEYGRSLGFSDEDLSNVIHNRELQVLRKAYLYDQGQTVAEKKTKNPPKMQRAANGRFTSKKGSKVDRLVERAKNARGGEKRDAEASAVLAILSE